MAEDIDLRRAWEQMGPEQREAVRRIAERRASLGPEEREAAALAAQREIVEQQADQAVEAVLDAARCGRMAALVPRLAEMAAYFGTGQADGSAYAGLAGFLRAVAAVLRGEAAPAVPEEYAERLGAVERVVSGSDHEHTKATKDAKQEERENIGRG